MAQKIGIRREDKNIWERRTPLTPDHVRTLLEQGLEVLVQPSKTRAFSDQAYREAGAKVVEDLSDCQVIFAIKEIPQEVFLPNRAYVFFAHVIKGQPHNMPMLGKILKLGCTLIDYEKISDQKGKRLIFFGRHAGLAGMLDSLWALGRRLDSQGVKTPFLSLRLTHQYQNLDQAQVAVREVGRQIANGGLPPGIVPLVFGFAGYGNVSQGAQEIFDLLPHQEVSPDQLPKLTQAAGTQRLFKTVFREEHLVKRKDSQKPFDLQEYYGHPERYQGNFSQYVPFLTVLINCIYWAPQYPRLITRELIRELYTQEKPPRLQVIGDISCDVEGSIECTLKCTDPGAPVYVYQPEDGRMVSGVAGNGPVVLAVDNLPCELPVEASEDFGEVLLPFVPAVAQADYAKPFRKLLLPAPVRRAVIAHRGRLTPDYKYLSAMIDPQQGGFK